MYAYRGLTVVFVHGAHARRVKDDALPVHAPGCAVLDPMHRNAASCWGVPGSARQQPEQEVDEAEPNLPMACVSDTAKPTPIGIECEFDMSSAQKRHARDPNPS